MPSPPATPAPRAASCFATEAVRQGRPEPPLPPFQPHPSPRLRQIKGGFLRSHQPSRPQEFLIGGKGWAPLIQGSNLRNLGGILGPCALPHIAGQEFSS